MSIEKHMGLLGMRATDKVTGFKGVVSSVSFDLYGCVQVVLTPAAKEERELGEGHWLDVGRLTVTGKKPVMAPPDFEKGRVAEGRKGAAPKPPATR